nr:uncharacterized protein LOC112132290 [Pongo abelii]
MASSNMIVSVSARKQKDQDDQSSENTRHSLGLLLPQVTATKNPRNGGFSSSSSPGRPAASALKSLDLRGRAVTRHYDRRLWHEGHIFLFSAVLMFDISQKERKKRKEQACRLIQIRCNCSSCVFHFHFSQYFSKCDMHIFPKGGTETGQVVKEVTMFLGCSKRGDHTVNTISLSIRIVIELIHAKLSSVGTFLSREHAHFDFTYPQTDALLIIIVKITPRVEI